jgi:hypothetical protein
MKRENGKTPDQWWRSGLIAGARDENDRCVVMT